MDGTPRDPNPSGDSDLLQYVELVRRRRRLIAGSVVAAAAISTVVSLMLPPVYEAKSTLMPVSRNRSRIGALLSDAGGLADLAGIGGAFPEESSDLLVSVLGSRTLAQRVIESENLLPDLFPGRQDASTGAWRGGEPAVDAAVDRLQHGALSVSVSGRGVITVSARLRDPAAAARLANGAVRELETFLRRNQLTASARTGAFLQTRKKESAAELLAAEESLRRFCEENGVISMPEQTRLLFEQISALSTQAAGKRARLEVAEKFGGPGNPDASTLRAEIQSLEKEILGLERGADRVEGAVVQTNGFIPLYDVPEKSLLYQRLVREVKAKQEVCAFLETELEAARIRQSREDIAFTVLDRAEPPRAKAGPRRLMIVGLSSAFTALAAFMLAALLERRRPGRTAPAEAPAR